MRSVSLSLAFKPRRCARRAKENTPDSSARPTRRRRRRPTRDARVSVSRLDKLSNPLPYTGGLKDESGLETLSLSRSVVSCKTMWWLFIYVSTTNLHHQHRQSAARRPRRRATRDARRASTRSIVGATRSSVDRASSLGAAFGAEASERLNRTGRFERPATRGALSWTRGTPPRRRSRCERDEDVDRCRRRWRRWCARRTARR